MIVLNRKEARQCIAALKDVAHDKAGRSQSPYLIEKEHTAEWRLACLLADRLYGKHQVSRLVEPDRQRA